MSLKNIPDSEFQKLLEALPSYNWDLAAKLEGLKSITEVPDPLWDEFIQFYKEYYAPKPTKKEIRKNILFTILLIIVFTAFIFFGAENIYTYIPQNIKNIFEPILAFSSRFHLLIKIALVFLVFSGGWDKLKTK